jgi:hypothetical protein
MTNHFIINKKIKEKWQDILDQSQKLPVS